MDIAKFKTIFDQLSPDQQRKAVAQLSADERREIVEFNATGAAPQKKGAVDQFSDAFASVRRPLQELQGIYYGIPRGLQDVAEGIDQTVRSGIETIAGGPVRGIPTQAETTATAEAGRAAFAAGPGQNPAIGKYRMAGNILPSFMVPAGPAGGLAGMGYTGLMSGLLNATEYQPPGQEESRLAKFGMGALEGMGFRGAVEGVRAFPAYVQRALETPIAKKGARLEQATGAQFLLGQKTGNRLIASMEAGLRETGLGAKTIDAQLKRATSYMKSVAQQFSVHPAERLTETSGRMLGEAATKAVRTYEHIRKSAADRAFGRFRETVGNDLIPVTNLRGKLYELAEGPVPGSAEAKSGAANAYRTLAKQLRINKGPNKGITGKQLDTWRQKFSGELFANLNKKDRGRIEKELMDALMADAEAYSGEAAAQLKTAVGVYRKGSEIIDAFKQQLPASVFGRVGPGGKMSKFDPFVASSKIERLSPVQIRGARNAIRPHNPEAWDATVSAFIYRNLDKATKTFEKLPGESGLSPNRFLEQMPTRQHLKELIPEPAQRKALVTGLALFDRIATKFGVGGGAQLGIRQTAADVASNAVSGNPIFIARLAGKTLGPLGLSYLMLTPKGHKVMRALAIESRNSVAYTKAMDEFLNQFEATPTEPQ